VCDGLGELTVSLVLESPQSITTFETVPAIGKTISPAEASVIPKEINALIINNINIKKPK
jgi:hypothetical protein